MDKKELANRLAQHMVETMDMEILITYAVDALSRDYMHYTEGQLISEVMEYAPHLLNPPTTDVQDLAKKIFGVQA